MFPRTLTLQRRTINFMGRGRAAGTVAYMDVGQGRTYELLSGQVVQTGPLYSLAQLDAPLPAVRIDRSQTPRPLAVGDRVLVAQLVHEPSGPRAGAAWVLQGTRPRSTQAPAPVPAPVPAPAPAPAATARHKGVVHWLHHLGAYGFILDERGQQVFVHLNDCNPGVLRLHQPVSYHLAATPRGWKAVQVASR